MTKYFTPSPRLETTFAGLKLRSPIGVGAVGRPMGIDIPPELHAEVLLKHAEEGGAGYIYVPIVAYASKESIQKLKEATKGTRPPVVSKFPPAERWLPAFSPRPYGIEGIMSQNTHPSVHNSIEFDDEYREYSLKTLDIIQKRKPEGVILIANVRGYGPIPDTYVDGAKYWADQGVDLIELIWNCPATLAMSGAVDDYFSETFNEGWPSSTMGQIPSFVENIQREVAKAVKIPTGAKLIPEIGFPAIVGMVRRIYAAGAKWITLAGGQLTMPPPDIYNRGKPLYPFCNINAFSAAFGSWLRASSYKNVAAIGHFVPDIAIAGSGGIVTPQQCVEMMMLGAGIVEITTAIMEQGRNILRRSNNFLAKFMSEQGYKSTAEIIGIAQQYIDDLDKVDFQAGNIVSETDMDKCTNCGICADAFCVCRKMVDGKLVVDTDNCTGCGGCLVSCHSVHAISLKQKVAR
jgi:dihydroorotate dehydrogenase/Pyruvate/2-oxoacid:ferredoxin oxidoreductase delta subunit